MLVIDRGKKSKCIKCAKNAHYRLYLDSETGDSYGLEFGICDNKNKCGYDNKPLYKSTNYKQPPPPEIKPKWINNELICYIFDCLKRVNFSTISKNVESTLELENQLDINIPDFSNFLKFKNNYSNLIEDSFSGRLHTPLTRMKKEFRRFILLDNEKTTSLDIAQAQPLFLSKILFDAIGENEFSTWLNAGEDIYLKLNPDRSKGKQEFYKIIFGKPYKSVFSGLQWFNWINEYKSKDHTLLAKLLQSKEVEIMKKVWSELKDLEIPFLTIHDEIIIKVESEDIATEILNFVLIESGFQNFKINSIPCTIPESYLIQSLESGVKNNFLEMISSKFGVENMLKVKQKYNIGTGLNGACEFWKVDYENNIRDAISIHYNGWNRDKNKMIESKAFQIFEDYNYKPCLFGEHLLNYDNKHIAIVEAPKTAVIASILIPEYTWIATAGANNLKNSLNVLRAAKRNVYLFPDLSLEDSISKTWLFHGKKHLDINLISLIEWIEWFNLTDSEILESKKAGLDLADFLIKEDYEIEVLEHVPPEEMQVEQPIYQNVKAENSGFIEVLELEQTEIKPLQTTFKPTLKKIDVTDRNEIDFSELENFFSNIGNLPTSIKIQETTFLDLSFTIEQSLKFRTKQNFNQLTRIKNYLQHEKI